LPLAATPESGPVSFEAAAPDASWTVVCEAREDTNGDGVIDAAPGAHGELVGDRLQRYLGLGNGEANRIDDLLAATPDGSFLVVRREGRAELVNTRTFALRELPGVELRRDSALPARRALVAENDALHYVRRNAAGDTELVLQALPGGGERVLYTTREEVLGLEPDPTGTFVVLEVVGADKNGNGRLDRPAAGDASPRSCSGPLPRARARRADVDASGFVVVPRAGGKARRVDDLALVFGRELIRRRADGALFGERDGRTRLLGDAACRGRVLFAEPERGILLIGCVLPKKPARLADRRRRAAHRRAGSPRRATVPALSRG
jgi:hypothetical protein